MSSFIPQGSKKIMNYINEMGFITDLQADKLLGKKDAPNRQFFINYLKRSKITEKGSGIYFALNSNAGYSKGKELCGWVILDSYTGEGDELFFSVDKPAQAGLVKNNMLYEFMHVDKNSKGMILALQEKFVGHIKTAESSDIKLIFVSDDKDIIEMISGMGLVVPNTIAIVKPREGQFPLIEYYGD